MDNNQFNENIYNNVDYNENNQEYNNEENNSNPNNHKGVLAILLGVCAVGIIILVIILVGFLSPKEEDPKDKELSPAVEEKHKEELMDAIDAYTTAVITSMTNNEYGPLHNSDNLYYIPVSSIKENSCVELDYRNPDIFGKDSEAYVVVNYRKENFSYDYYFTFYDSFGYSMKLMKVQNVFKDKIQKSDEVNKDTITKQEIDLASNIVVLKTPNESPNNSCKAK